MSELRAALDADIHGLWAAVRTARLFSTEQEFAALRDAAPWRVCVSDSGEVAVLAPWREHADLLAIRGLWANPARIPVLVDEIAAVARARGFSQLLSPLLSTSAFAAYQRAGMDVRERIVALQGFAGEIVEGPRRTAVEIRRADAGDFEFLERLDADCFDEFWRYGRTEIAQSHARERMTVAVGADGMLAGYATCSLHGASATVGRLAVAPEARRAGVGRALLAEAASWASRQEAYALTLCTQESNSASRRLYSAAGLFEISEPYLIGVCSV